MKQAFLLATLLLALAPSAARAQAAAARVEENVIVGMYSGLSLLMDVHRPERPNGYGVVVVPGSSWRAPLAWNARPLKQGLSAYREALLEAGYTVFAINHRAAPRFPYPAALEDVQRAVRHIRHNAAAYGISPERIGALGHSSGGHLVMLNGLRDAAGNPRDSDPVERESPRVQAVVSIAGPVDFLESHSTVTLSSWLGMSLGLGGQPDTTSTEYRTYRDATPLSHVTPDDPPVLLMHGEADPIANIRNSEVMHQALQAGGVVNRFLRIPGGSHSDTFGRPPNAPDFMGEAVGWFDRHLRGQGGATTGGGDR